MEWAAGADEGVPRGAVGAVLAYNGRGRVRVAFPRGAWNFKPAELRLVADRGLSPPALAALGALCDQLVGKALDERVEP